MHIWKQRVRNRLIDLYAIVIAGRCNHKPYSPLPGVGGGYAHWRCQKPRGHKGLHRGINYVWNEGGRTEYRPVLDGPPRLRWEPTMTLTRKQARERRRWHDRREAYHYLPEGRCSQPMWWGTGMPAGHCGEPSWGSNFADNPLANNPKVWKPGAYIPRWHPLTMACPKHGGPADPRPL